MRANWKSMSRGNGPLVFANFLDTFAEENRLGVREAATGPENHTIKGATL
jgi:hypothetical protein